MSSNAKAWLQKNKIYFETIAASLLSIMAITISYFQIITGVDQNRIAEKQFELGKQQLDIIERNEKNERTAK